MSHGAAAVLCCLVLCYAMLCCVVSLVSPMPDGHHDMEGRGGIGKCAAARAVTWVSSNDHFYGA